MSQTLTQRDEDTQLRLDFVSFVRRCFHELSPRTKYHARRGVAPGVGEY